MANKGAPTVCSPQVKGKMRRKHPGGGMHHRCTSAGLPASMAFRWRKSPCRPSLSQKNTALRGRMAQICGKSKKSEQAGAGTQAGGRGARPRARGTRRHGQASGRESAGAGARAGAFESTGRTHIRRIYEKVEADPKLERIGLIDRYRRYRQAKVAWHRNTAVFAPMHRQGIPPGPRKRPFPRCCRRIPPGVRAKKAKSLRNNSTRDCAPLFFHVGRLHHPR